MGLTRINYTKCIVPTLKLLYKKIEIMFMCKNKISKNSLLDNYILNKSYTMFLNYVKKKKYIKNIMEL